MQINFTTMQLANRNRRSQSLFPNLSNEKLQKKVAIPMQIQHKEWGVTLSKVSLPSLVNQGLSLPTARHTSIPRRLYKLRKQQCRMTKKTVPLLRGIAEGQH